MSRAITNSRPLRLFARSTLIVWAACLAACTAGPGEAGICYSKFYPSELPEFTSAFTEQMKKLQETLVDAYNDDAPIVDLPMAQAGALYLASTCEYAASLRSGLDKSILVLEISKEEYEHKVALASRSGRIIRMERN